MSFTPREKADEAAREIGMRRHVYPKRNPEGRMTPAQQRAIAIMLEIEADYRAQITESENELPLATDPDMFGGEA